MFHVRVDVEGAAAVDDERDDVRASVGWEGAARREATQSALDHECESVDRLATERAQGGWPLVEASVDHAF